jgi:hypothetical protein
VVPNFAESPIDAVALLLRTATALRESRADTTVRRVSPADGLAINYVR